jgi:hypothetical protein
VYPLAREVPLDIDACNFVVCHIGLDLVVLFQEREEVVEMFDAHVLNTKVISDEAKLDRTPLVSPKSRRRVGLNGSHPLPLTVEEIIGQNASLGQPKAAMANFKVDPPIDVFLPSKPILQNKLFWNVCDFDTDVLWIFHWCVEVEILCVKACKPCTLPSDDTVENEFNDFQ